MARSLPVQQAIALASKFLPPHATDGKDPPLVAFALFRDDAYSLGPEAIVVDLDHIYEEGGLTEPLAHEFHHSYLSGLSAIRYPDSSDPSVPLVRALTYARNEGIADVAREIYETFGVDSLFPGVRNPFAFWRTYAEAEARRGNPPPFSAKTVALLDALERRCLADKPSR